MVVCVWRRVGVHQWGGVGYSNGWSSGTNQHTPYTQGQTLLCRPTAWKWTAAPPAPPLPLLHHMLLQLLNTTVDTLIRQKEEGCVCGGDRVVGELLLLQF